MVRRLRAHFDGRVIVPDEPVALPINQPLQVEVSAAATGTAEPDPAIIAERLRALERVTGIFSAPTIPDEALRRENLYDED